LYSEIIIINDTNQSFMSSQVNSVKTGSVYVNYSIRHLTSIFIIIISLSASAQVGFRGILLNKQDSTPVQFAIIKSIDLGSFTQTTIDGKFQFPLSQNIKNVRFEISAIGLRDTIVFRRTKNAEEKIYIERPLLSLTPVTVKGLSAKETVRLAVDMIPVNYTDSSYAAFSFFRQYDNVNGLFKNLIEVQGVILVKLSLENNRFKQKFGYDVEQMRRSNFKNDIDDFDYYQDDYEALFREDPVYNLLAGALNPNAFNFYTFNFDTTNHTDDFVIKYSCKEFSSEGHGVGDLRDLNWSGEGVEEGKFVIDSKTFAFKKIERKALRNKDFKYPLNNNWLMPSKQFYEEFVDGYLVTEYNQVNGKWFLSKILHRFTNDYFRGKTLKKEYTVKETYEWYADSVTHFIGPKLADKFFVDTYLPSCNYTYDPEKWKASSHPFFFDRKEDVYLDMEKITTVEEQFENNGKQKIK